MEKKCKQCGQMIEPESAFCLHCGAPVEDSAPTAPKPQATICPQCGSKIVSGGKFCGRCGTPIAANTTQPSQQNHPTEQITAMPPPAATIPAAPAPPPKSINWKGIGSALSTIVTIIVVILIFTKHPVYDTKEIVFSQWGAKTLGTAVSETISSANWSSEKISKNNYHVTVSGYCAPAQITLSLTFNVTYSGDHVYAQPIHGKMDSEEFDDVVSLGIAMAIIYDKAW